MSAPVDVLAVMDAAAARWRLVHEVAKADAMTEARAAVAELIDKADSALTLGFSDTAARELRAALARVQP